MSHWFPKYNIGELKDNKQEIDNSSIIYVDNNAKIINGFGDVDHVLGSDDLQITSEYTWDFIEDDEEYPQENNIRIGEVWDIGPAYPDHAMLISEIGIVY